MSRLLQTGVALVVIVFTGIAGACTDVDETETDIGAGIAGEEEDVVGPDRLFSPAEVLEDDRLVGDEVAVSAAAVEVLVPGKALVIGAHEENRVLVLVPEGVEVPEDLDERTTGVLVVGRVIELALVALDEMEGFGPDFFAAAEKGPLRVFEGTHAVVADTIDRAPLEDVDEVDDEEAEDQIRDEAPE